MNLWCEQCVSLWMYARAKPLDWPGRLIKGMTIQYNTHNAILAGAPNKGGDWQASLWRHCQTLPGGRCLFLTLIIFFLPLVLYAFYQWEPWPENLIFWGILHFTNKQIWDQKNKETTWPKIICWSLPFLAEKTIVIRLDSWKILIYKDIFTKAILGQW